MGKVLVTGAAGFIGSHVVEALIAAGHIVVGVDNFDPFYPRAQKEANLAAIGERAGDGGGASFHEADIRDQAAMARLMSEHEVGAIVHLAAKAGVRPSLAAPLDYLDVNVGGTVSLLEAARQAGVGRMVFVSSSSVYGAANALPFREDQPVQSPMSPYAASKIAAEAVCYAYHHLYGLDLTCLRLFTVYGPRQRPDLAINSFVRRMIAGEALRVYGDGTSTRDYTYVGDIVAGVTAALQGELGFAIINLGSARPVSILDLIGAVEDVTEIRARVEHLPPVPGDMPHTFADIARAKALLGWEPEVSLREGLSAFVQWWRSSSRVC
jgi:UDP-glucuronate 4-epimerase